MASESKMPEIKSVHSLTKKYLTPEIWEKYKDIVTPTANHTLEKVIATAIAKDDQHVGVYAGDAECYEMFREFMDPVINEYHNYGEDQKHMSDMDAGNIKGNIGDEVTVKSTRIRVGRNIRGFGFSPGISPEHRKEVEELMKEVFASLDGDLAGTYYPLLGMKEEDRLQLVADHFLFKSGDANLQIAGMERDWPEGRGIFHNKEKTFLVWVNEEDQLRIISMQKGGDVKAVFERLSRGIAAVEKILKEKGKEFAFDDRLGFHHTCPTNLGTGMRASVHIELPGWCKKKDELKKRCEELALQPRGAYGETGGDSGALFDISNKHRLGYSEVQLVQTMIDGVNTLFKEDGGA